VANTSKTFFGFAIADSMFPGSCQVTRKPLSVEEVKELVEAGVESACNPSHRPTIDVMKKKFGLEVGVPEKAPIIALKPGDSIIVMSVRGLPRLENRHEYSEEEIALATFTFGLWTVIA
jgi:hypothetical protein